MPSVSVYLRSVVLTVDLGVDKVILEPEATFLQPLNDGCLIGLDYDEVYEQGINQLTPYTPTTSMGTDVAVNQVTLSIEQTGVTHYLIAAPCKRVDTVYP